MSETPRTTIPFSPKALLFLSLLLSLAIAIFVERRIFWDPNAINDDVRNQAYWMAQIINPSLFSNDLIAAYFTQPSLISPVVWLFYKIASFWVDPIRFSQFLPFPLIVIATLCLFKFAELKGNARYAFWVCWLMNLFIWTIRVFAGGLPRGFSYPLLFFFLWQYEKRNLWMVNLSLCLCALIYPPMLMLTLGVVFYDFWAARREARKSLAAVLWGLAGCLVIMGWRSMGQSPLHFGEITQLKDALQIPELFPGGRIPLFLLPDFSHFVPNPWPFLQLFLQIIPHLYITIPILALVAVWILYHRKYSAQFGPLYIPTVLPKLAGASVVLYLLAWLLLFYLYVPERYLQFTLPLIIVFTLAAIFDRLSTAWAGRTTRIAILALIPLVIMAPLWKSDLIQPSPDSLNLMRFLRSMPENVMISANLGLSSHIPALARRSVFLSHEGYIPFHRQYFREMKARLKSWLRAYYATDAKPIREFIQQYPLDYIIVDANDYESERLSELAENHYHAFNPAFFGQLKHGQGKSHYLLLKLAKKIAIYKNGPYYVIRVQDLMKTLLMPPGKARA